MKSTYNPGITAARMDKILPDFISESLKIAMSRYDQKMRGYISENALVVGLGVKDVFTSDVYKRQATAITSHPFVYPAGRRAMPVGLCLPL